VTETVVVAGQAERASMPRTVAAYHCLPPCAVASSSIRSVTQPRCLDAASLAARRAPSEARFWSCSLVERRM
jgi:hypothetical protein